MILVFLLLWYAVFSIIAFCLMGIDKHRAKHNRWRIPEMTLISTAYFGGFIGYILGMKLFHHKTSKWYFYINFIFALILHGILIYVLYKNGVLI